MVFASGAVSDVARVAAAAAEVLGTRSIAGATTHGVLAARLEEEERPAVAVLALTGVAATPFRLEDLDGAEEAAGAELEGVLQGSAREGDLVVLLADPIALDLPRLLAALDEVLPPRALVGAAAAVDAGSPSGRTWSGHRPVARGASGLILHLEQPARIVVSQGCRPISERLPVTRVEGHWLLEIDGRPALEVYRAAAGRQLGADLAHAGSRLLVALPRGPDPGDFVARHVTGFAPERQAFALATELRPRAPLQFALRDADLAREDFRRALVAAHAPAAAALYTSCPGRGQSLFRHTGLEAAYLANAIGATPVAGCFGSFQFGPVGSVTELHTYASVLTLLS